MPEGTEPRILVLDIETSLFLAYTFAIRDTHITHKQIADLTRSSRTIACVGMKWAGERKTTVLSEWKHGYEAMMQGVHDALCEADGMVTFNGVSFDVPKLEGQFGLLNMEPPPWPTQIDIYKTTRKWGLPSGKLDYLAPALGLGSKVKHEGLQMWIDVYNGCPKAQAKMERYCAGDVRLTEQVFDRVKPFIRNMPRLRSGGQCSSCNSNNVQRRGYNYAKNFKTERIFCLEPDCRSWTTGKRTSA